MFQALCQTQGPHGSSRKKKYKMLQVPCRRMYWVQSGHKVGAIISSVGKGLEEGGWGSFLPPGVVWGMKVTTWSSSICS